MLLTPHGHYFFVLSQTHLSDQVLKISALPASTIGKMCDQVNQAKRLTYRGTVRKDKSCLTSEKGQFPRGSCLNYSMRKQVIFLKLDNTWLISIYLTSAQKDVFSLFLPLSLFSEFVSRRPANKPATLVHSLPRRSILRENIHQPLYIAADGSGNRNGDGGEGSARRGRAGQGGGC